MTPRGKVVSRVSTSLPSRGAWIEIEVTVEGKSCVYVAPLAGSVDRNPLFW